jgi:hypothetical protein
LGSLPTMPGLPIGVSVTVSGSGSASAG